MLLRAASAHGSESGGEGGGEGGAERACQGRSRVRSGAQVIAHATQTWQGVSHNATHFLLAILMPSTGSEYGREAVWSKGQSGSGVSLSASGLAPHLQIAISHRQLFHKDLVDDALTNAAEATLKKAKQLETEGAGISAATLGRSQPTIEEDKVEGGGVFGAFKFFGGAKAKKPKADPSPQPAAPPPSVPPPPVAAPAADEGGAKTPRDKGKDKGKGKDKSAAAAPSAAAVVPTPALKKPTIWDEEEARGALKACYTPRFFCRSCFLEGSGVLLRDQGTHLQPAVLSSHAWPVELARLRVLASRVQQIL